MVAGGAAGFLPEWLPELMGEMWGGESGGVGMGIDMLRVMSRDGWEGWRLCVVGVGDMRSFFRVFSSGWLGGGAALCGKATRKNVLTAV